MNKWIVLSILMGGFMLSGKKVYAHGDISPDQVEMIVNTIKIHNPVLQDIPTPLVMGFVAAESSFRKTVESSAKAKGLMQLKDSTFNWMITQHPEAEWTGDIWNPMDNIQAGMFFFKWLETHGKSNLFATIQMYNTGMNGYLKKGYRARSYATKVLTNAVSFIL